MPPKRVAILQSNYIPWKGYFDIIHRVDEFVLFDSVQYTRRDWRNRNRIKTPHGLLWLTIPVHAPNHHDLPIQEVQVSHQNWVKEHWQTITYNYARAPYFELYRDVFSDLYASINDTHLSQINFHFIAGICKLLGITTHFSWSSDYELSPDKNLRLINICQQAGATHYLSGPAAKTYIDEGLFTQAGIQVEYMDYANYPEYPQQFGDFEHSVSVLDLLFNMGEQAPQYMMSF